MYSINKDSPKHSGESSEDEEKSEAVWSKFTSANPYTALDDMDGKQKVWRQD